ncbi:MAG: uridine diphosphate-N-acetylglucosamine-binding protein YvcK [Candidatus Korobacteraceae bacterium]
MELDPSGRSSRGTGLKVVAIGGGTGLSTLLRGLKQYVIRPGETSRFEGPWISELTGIVTVSDDGGSSGRLRKELKLPPPGDVRNCIVALSEDEALLSRLFQYRFRGDTALDGHSFGNLFLAALAGVTGDFAEAVRLSSEILATRGHIYPATTSDVELEGIMDDGSRVRGETSITGSQRRVVRLELVPPNVEPLPETLQAIQQADLITLGPGSLFTSLIPNLLVKGMPEAIAESKAIKAYVCNLMTQANESLGLTAADHIRAIYAHSRHRIFQFALVNNKVASRELRAKYALEASTQIVVDEQKIKELGVQPVFGDYMEEEGGVARHATERVAKDLLGLEKSGVSGQRVEEGQRAGTAR